MTRVVVDPDGSRWRERDMGGGRVERTLLGGGSPIYRAFAKPVRLIDSGVDQQPAAEDRPTPRRDYLALPPWWLP